MWQYLQKTKLNLTNLKHSICDKTPKTIFFLQNSKKLNFDKTQELLLGKKSKNQIVEKNQQLIWGNFKIQIMTNLKNSNFDKILKQIVTKLNSNCDKLKFKLWQVKKYNFDKIQTNF